MIKITRPAQSADIPRGSGADVRSWQVGQVLNATTERGGDASSTVLLRIGQQLLSAKTPVTLQSGEHIKLLVKTALDKSNGNPPTLKLLTPLLARANGSELSGTSAAAAIKLRQFIAAQSSFGQLQRLGQNILGQASLAKQLPAPLKQALDRLQTNVIHPGKDFGHAQLKQHIANSGLFLESRLRGLLAQAEPKSSIRSLLTSDLKSQLLAASAELRQYNRSFTENRPANAPLDAHQLNLFIKELKSGASNTQQLAQKLLSSLPQSVIKGLVKLLTGTALQDAVPEQAVLLSNALNKLLISNNQKQTVAEQLQFRLMLVELQDTVEQSIRQLTSQQLQPLSKNAEHPLSLFFNLVFTDDQQLIDVKLRIQQQDDASAGEADSWQITLDFNFTTLGRVQSRIHLQDKQVSTIFGTELPATAERIQQLLPMLERGLSNAGLTVKNLSVTSSELQPVDPVDHDVHLLDETA